MPIYAYRCQSCGHSKDVLQKLSDAQLTDCPACHQPSFVKQITAAGFQLKGSGWYATDFRNNGNAKPAGADANKDQGAAAAATPSGAGGSGGAGAGQAGAPNTSSGASSGTSSSTSASASTSAATGAAGCGGACACH